MNEKRPDQCTALGPAALCAYYLLENSEEGS